MERKQLAQTIIHCLQYFLRISRKQRKGGNRHDDGFI